MKIKSIFKLLTITAFIFSTTLSFSQTKKERKAQMVDLETGMYDGTESKEALAFYEQAIDLSKTKDYKGAIKLYKKSVKEDPEFVEAYDNMGRCYRNIGDFKNALACYNKSIELYPNGTMAYMNKGVIFGIQKEWDKAIAEYEKIQKIDPNDPEGYYGCINPYMNLGDFKSAAENAKKTVEIYEAIGSPYLKDAQYMLGVSYYYDNDKTKAKVYLKLAKDNGFQLPNQFKEEFDL